MKNNYLVMVYNAESDLFSTVSDFVHKIVSPATYGCSLCTLTFSNTGIKKQWKSFLDGIEMGKEFLHKNEFTKKYNIQVTPPAILYSANGSLQLLISAAELNRLNKLDELIALMKVRTDLLKI